MRHRRTPHPGLVAAACLGLALGACGPSQPEAPLSVLLLTVDTLRPDYMGSGGYEPTTTPFLDELLARGLSFPGAVAPMGRTTPALASLLTGAYPHTTGVRTLTDPLRPEVVPLTEVLRERGYQTVAVVTNFLLTPERRLDRGFAVYDHAHDVRPAMETVQAALEPLEALDPGAPAFVWVHLIDPHVPYHPPRELAERFDPGYEGPYRLHFGYQPRPGEGRRAFRPFPRNLPKTRAVHQNDLASRVNEHIRRLYAADVGYTDSALAPLVETMERLYPDTLLTVFTADHGESLGEHDYYFDHGEYVYNPELRVPLTFLLPRGHPLERAGRCDGWVSLVDVAPTLLDLLGEVPPAFASQVEGRSLRPCFEGRPLPPLPVFAESGHSLYFEHVRKRRVNDVSGRFRAVILGDWKLIWTPFAPPEETWELYDLSRDPGEERNLYEPGHPEYARLRSLLREWLRRDRTGPTDSAPSEEDLEALRALGYVD